MATTRTPGITVLADGRRFIDKRYLGVRIGLRVGAVTQEQAEERLQKVVQLPDPAKDLAVSGFRVELLVFFPQVVV